MTKKIEQLKQLRLFCIRNTYIKVTQYELHNMEIENGFATDTIKLGQS